MRPIFIVSLATAVLTFPHTLSGQDDGLTQRWLENCRNNWDHDRSNFCELRNFTLQPQSKLAVDGRANGGVSFHGWDRNEVKIVAMIQANASDDDQAEALAKHNTVTT